MLLFYTFYTFSPQNLSVFFLAYFESNLFKKKKKCRRRAHEGAQTCLHKPMSLVTCQFYFSEMIILTINAE